MGQTLTTRQPVQSAYGAIDESADTVSPDDVHVKHQNVNGSSSGYRTSVNSTMGASSSSSEQYEELMKNSMTCPTCKGLGRVSRDQENELVAIIPLKDQRLKPRRTWLVIVLTIIVCSVVAGLVLFFIIPRSISASSMMVDRVIEPFNVTLEEFREPFSDPKFRMNISFTEPIGLSNDNFFPVQVKEMQIDVNYPSQQHDSSLVLTLLYHYDNSSLGDETVPLRSSASLFSDLSITLDSRLDNNRDGFNTHLIRQCMENPSLWSYINLVINATVYYEYLGNAQRQTLSYDRHVGCYPYDDSLSTLPTTEAVTNPSVITKRPLTLNPSNIASFELPKSVDHKTL